ncbi:MAG: class I tRNA ligase family protein, partial [Bdellovibrionaceae bacterium]|nr:class I tRNA ligase family protein [Pseudobdellovibrionaceae bacterium]
MSHLKVYNSLTQNLEDFSPWQPPVVKMYCCGPTVYDYLHVGNFRGAVFYQFLRQVLRAEGYQVRFVYNFTDIDDKIIDRANKEGRPAEEISEFYIQEFWKDFDSLGLERHDHNPKVTETLKEIESFIQRLIDQGYAYVTAQGDVYFSINQFPEYGKLSHRQVEQMRQ